MHNDYFQEIATMDEAHGDLDRRWFLKGSAAVTGLAAAGVPLAGRAQGKGELVVGNWGGDWNSNVMKALETPLLEAKGITVRRDLSSAPARKTKLLAERQLPRGTIDVAHFTDADAYELQIQDALEEIDYSRIPNAQHLLPGMRGKYFVPWVYSGVVLIYNPQKISQPPTSFADLLDPRYADRVGLIDQIYFNYLYAYALLAGGSMKDVKPGLEKLLEMKRTVRPRIYASHQQIAAAMAADEVWISANYQARAAQWQAAGLPIRGSYPVEGGIAIQFGVVIPRRARNKDNAYRYLNEMLSPQACGELARLTYYAPAVANADLPAELKSSVEFTESQRKRLNYVDYDYAARNQSQWLEWWNKNIKV